MISFILTKSNLLPSFQYYNGCRAKNFFVFTTLKKLKIKKSINTTSTRILMSNQSENSLEIWEVDFFSRPVVNSDGKKIWELIVVNNNQTFQHNELVPNNLVNSKELKKRMNEDETVRL